jgi:hypothetical protein
MMLLEIHKGVCRNLFVNHISDGSVGRERFLAEPTFHFFPFKVSRRVNDHLIPSNKNSVIQGNAFNSFKNYPGEELFSGTGWRYRRIV